MRTSRSRQPGGKARRLAGSAVFGAAVAAALVAWTDLHNHAALVASAAAPEPKGQHETVGFILATGGIFTFLIMTLVAFAVVTVLARRRNARPAVSLYPPAAPRRRSRTYARR